MAAPDPFAAVKKQAQRALAVVMDEIRRREAELEKLLEQAEQWRAAIAGTGPTTGRRASGQRSKTAGKRRSAKKRSSGKRTNWDEVLKGLPKTFTVDDVMKRPGAKARGRAQVYPTRTRWMEGKKVKRGGKGKYQKL